jgi:hypothetical protein
MSSEKPTISLDATQKKWIAILAGLFSTFVAAALIPKDAWKNTPQISLETIEKSPSEETITSRGKKNEEIFAVFQEKVKNNPQYTPTRAERIALAQLWVAVNDGAPIPYEWDGNKE